MNARSEAARVAKELRAARVPDADFEAELLVRAAAGLSRPEYFARPELSPEASARLDELARRRAAREPFAYISGMHEFFGLEFEVGPDVLIPRAETEALVETGLAEIETVPGAATVIDIGTGSGAVAVSVALYAPTAHLVAIDVSRRALAVARSNASRLGAEVEFAQGHLAAAVGRADIVLANLPYIPTLVLATLEPEVRDWEPRLALDGGPDGLRLIRELVDDCAGRLRPRLLALEVAIDQADVVGSYGEATGAEIEVVADLAGIDRVVCLRWA